MTWTIQSMGSYYDPADARGVERCAPDEPVPGVEFDCVLCAGEIPSIAGDDFVCAECLQESADYERAWIAEQGVDDDA